MTAGNPFSVTVTAENSSGDVATGYLGTVQFTSSDSQAGLPANYTFVAGDDGSIRSRSRSRRPAPSI